MEHNVGEQAKAEVTGAGGKGVAEGIASKAGGEDVGFGQLPPHPRAAGDCGHDGADGLAILDHAQGFGLFGAADVLAVAGVVVRHRRCLCCELPWPGLLWMLYLRERFV